MAIVKSETFEGKTYILSDSLDIWMVEIGFDGVAQIQRLDHVSGAKALQLCEPLFAEWVQR